MRKEAQRGRVRRKGKKEREAKAYADGRAAAAGKAPMPPAYVELIKTLMRLTVEWCGAEPALPDLKWLDPGDTLFIGPLSGDSLRYLCDSPDARRLCAWLDDKTNREATLFQMTMALRFLGHLPGGPQLETRFESAAFRSLQDFANQTGTDTRLAQSTCATCGKRLDAASGAVGTTPRPGDISLCVYCGAINAFTEGLGLRALSDDELDALPAKLRDQAQEMRDLLRAAKASKRTGAAVQA